MEQKRISIVGSKRHIPEELWPNILSRLPVKSLLRFRCVSQSWLSLINDPDFCRLHLKNFKNNNDETHLLVVECMPKRCVLRCSDTFETNMLLTLPRSYHQGDWWQVLFSVDGLVLLKSGTSDLPDDEELMVWNPSIRKFHDIPFLPEIETSLMDIDVGLGYDPLAKDYKYVKLLSGERDDIVPSVAIYTLGTASWKIIEFQGKGFSRWLWDPESMLYNTLYLQGKIYCLAKNHESDNWELVSFDLSSEVFSRISWPDAVENRFAWRFTLAGSGCSLAVFDFDGGNMWVLESSSMCWTRRYSFDLRVPESLYLKKNGDIVMTWVENTSFKLATGKEFMKQCWTLVSSYNLETQKERLLLHEKRPDLEMIDMCGYSESLILLKWIRSILLNFLKCTAVLGIPSSTEMEVFADALFKEAEIGLGYDPFVRDYRYVRLLLNNPPLVAVYTMELVHGR